MAARLRSPVVFAVLATLIVRGLVAAARMDELELELYSGSMAQAWLAGMPTELAQLPVIPHNRGSVVLGILLVPLFAVLGPTLAAIKVLAIAISAATAGLLVGIVDRHLGRVAAWSTGLFVALLPPTYQMVDVLALGSHAESVLFTLLACSLVLGSPGALVSLGALGSPGASPAPRSAGALFGAGCALGFAVFFSLQSLIAIPALAVAWFARDPRFFLRRNFLLYLLGAGLWIPLARLFLLPEHAAVIDSQSATDRLLPNGVGAALSKLGDTLAGDLPASWGFAHYGGAALGWLWYAAALLGGVALVRRCLRREPWAVFFLLYPPLVLAAYAASNFEFKLDENLDGMGSRFVVPMLPICAVWIAAGGQALASMGARPESPAAAARAWMVPAVVAGVVGGAGAWGLVALLASGGRCDQPMVRGTELAHFHGHLEHASGRDFVRRLEWVQRVEPDWRADQPLIHKSFDPWPGSVQSADEVELYLASIRSEPEELRPFFWVQLGREAALGLAPAEVAAIAPQSSEAETWFFRGVGNQMLQHLLAWFGRNRAGDPDGEATLARYFGELQRLAPGAQRAAVDGLGFTLGSRLTPYQPLLLAVLRGNPSIPLVDRAPFFRALGRGYRSRFRESTYEVPVRLRIEAFLAERDRVFFREGLEVDAR